MTPAELAALKAELALPAYKGKGDEDCALLINTTVRQVDRETLDGGQLLASIVRSEFALLNAADKQYVQLLSVGRDMPLTQTLKTELGGVFGAGTATRASLLSLLKRAGTRSQELGLSSVSPSDIADARKA